MARPTSAARTAWVRYSSWGLARTSCLDGRRACCIASRVAPTQVFPPALSFLTRRGTFTVQVLPAAIHRVIVARSSHLLEPVVVGAKAYSIASEATEMAATRITE